MAASEVSRTIPPSPWTPLLRMLLYPTTCVPRRRKQHGLERQGVLLSENVVVVNDATVRNLDYESQSRTEVQDSVRAAKLKSSTLYVSLGSVIAAISN